MSLNWFDKLGLSTNVVWCFDYVETMRTRLKVAVKEGCVFSRPTNVPLIFCVVSVVELTTIPSVRAGCV